MDEHAHTPVDQALWDIKGKVLNARWHSQAGLVRDKAAGQCLYGQWMNGGKGMVKEKMRRDA